MATTSPEKCIYTVANSWGECRFKDSDPNNKLPSHASWIDTGFRKDGRVANVTYSQILACTGENRGCNAFAPVDNLKR